LCVCEFPMDCHFVYLPKKKKFSWVTIAHNHV
jgi:hypothetical protein